MNNEENFYLTIEQRDQRRAELKRLVNVEIPRNAEEIEEARKQGDLSENAEYDAAKDRQAELHQQKTKIERILANATIVKENTSNEFVELNHTVTIEWLDGKYKSTKEDVKVLGFGNGRNEIAIDSPLGKSLLGKKINDVINFEAPSGRLRVKLLKIK